jgi:heptaprenyl diphosphate synthase
MKKINVHKLTLISLLAALAIVIAIEESFIPSIGIPGVKLGLANIVILVILYELGIVEAILVDLLRVFIVGLMRGNIVSMGFVMSITGATLSLSVMIIFYLLTKKFSIVGVSVIDSIFHVTGQVVVAMLFLESRYVLYYLPFIALSAIIAGIFVGIVARLIIKTGMIFLWCITVGLFT